MMHSFYFFFISLLLLPNKPETFPNPRPKGVRIFSVNRKSVSNRVQSVPLLLPSSCTCVLHRRFFSIVQGGLRAPVACRLLPAHRPCVPPPPPGVGFVRGPLVLRYACELFHVVCSVGGVYVMYECGGGCWLTEGTRQGRQMVTFWSKLP